MEMVEATCKVAVVCYAAIDSSFHKNTHGYVLSTEVTEST